MGYLIFKTLIRYLIKFIKCLIKLMRYVIYYVHFGFMYLIYFMRYLIIKKTYKIFHIIYTISNKDIIKYITNFISYLIKYNIYLEHGININTECHMCMYIYIYAFNDHTSQTALLHWARVGLTKSFTLIQRRVPNAGPTLQVQSEQTWCQYWSNECWPTIHQTLT